MVNVEIALQRLVKAWDGRITPPTNLEAAIAELDLSRPDTWIERLSSAAHTEFGDVPQTLATLADQDANLLPNHAARLCWIVDTLTKPDTGHERSELRVEAALISSAFWGDNGLFWTALRSHFEGHHKTMAAFEIALSRREPQATIPYDAPIWEREHIEALYKAEQDGDWEEVGERAPAFRHLPHIDTGARQAALALALLDWPRLIRIADKTNSWFQAHMLLNSLPREDRFRVASASRSDHVRFAVLDQVANRQKDNLSPAEEKFLRNLLIILAKDEKKWPIWLTICNRYPVRHPHMQIAFGKALARCGQGSIQSYVDSISLSTADDETREVVTRCLSEFRAETRGAKRRVLWEKAFCRWTEWNFGSKEDKEISGISRSALDYAVVGWLVESAARLRADDLEITFSRDIQSLDMIWHPSINSAASCFFRLLSRYQVLFHATRLLPSDSDWLPGPTLHIPAAASDDFVRRRYTRDDF